MKVKEVMTSPPVFVEEDYSVKKFLRLVFTTNTPGFSVVKKNKLIGFIAEEDIFFKIYDVSSNTTKSKKILSDVLDKKVKDFMIRKVFAVSPEDELIDAQAILYKYNFFQLPVVDKNNNLLGVLTRGDVFRHVIDDEIPFLESDQYANFVSETYDQMVDWEKRFEYEFPTLFRIFAKKNVEKVLEIGTWTGEYAIELARNGVEVAGIDDNLVLINTANLKLKNLPEKVKKRLSFKLIDYQTIDKNFPKKMFDAAICMGGVLPYISGDIEKVLTGTRKVLKNNGVFILQLLNLERVVEDRKRFLYFKIKEGKGGTENLYVEFFDKKNESKLIHNVIHFISSEGRWIYRGINSVEIKYIKNEQVVPLLKRCGFTDITVTGNKGEFKGVYGQMSLVKPFDLTTSDWMTVIASA